MVSLSIKDEKRTILHKVSRYSWMLEHSRKAWRFVIFVHDALVLLLGIVDVYHA
jgi:hypothetical protein